jgi:hypothetical protein
VAKGRTHADGEILRFAGGHRKQILVSTFVLRCWPINPAIEDSKMRADCSGR